MTIASGERDDFSAPTARVLESLRDVNEQLVLAVVEAQQQLDAAGRALQRVERTTEHDSLTGLPGRTLMLDRFGQAAAIAQRHGRRLAVLVFDLNDFKRVNDELGAATGDAVLRNVATALSASVRTADTVCRQGGDEFVVLLTDLVSANDAAVIAATVCSTLALPMHIGDQVVHLSASCGISIFPDHGLEAGGLIALADAAMHDSKRRGNGCFAFHSGSLASSTEPASQEPAPKHARASARDDRNTAIRDANEQLVLAALTAQDHQTDAEEAQRRQTEFMAIMAHELRTPLAPMRNVSALLERLSADDPMLPRLKAMIERQVDHMARLVDDLLDVSRVVTGKLRLRLEAVTMATVVHEAVMAARTGIDRRRQTFTLELPEQPVMVLGDPLRLVQVVGNLLENASKYTPIGGALSLTMTADERQLTLTVVDTGIGITEAALPGVFGLFAQDAHAVGYSGVGLGIGLTVVHELVHAHGGTVTAHSPGVAQGSRFVVTLPLLPPVLPPQPIA